MEIIKFARDYPKLQDDVFSTIRKSPKKLRTGQKVLIKSPNHEFKAIIITARREYLRDIGTGDLTNDTSTESREEALMILREYYPDLDEDSLVQMIWFVPYRK